MFFYGCTLGGKFLLSSTIGVRSVLIEDADFTNGATACVGFPAIVFSLLPVIEVFVVVFTFPLQHLIVAAIEAAKLIRGDFCSLIYTHWR
jgi:hypothetical protein